MDDNEAYDLSLFESDDTIRMSSEAKKSMKKKKSGKVISISQGSSAKAQRRKRNPMMIFSVTLLTAAIAAVAIMMVQNYARINEINEKITEKSKIYTTLQDEGAQYQIRIDKVLTDSYVKEYAETKLGMLPVKNAQKKFISLSSGDKGEVLERDSDKNIFEKAYETIRGIFM